MMHATAATHGHARSAAPVPRPPVALIAAIATAAAVAVAVLLVAALRRDAPGRSAIATAVPVHLASHLASPAQGAFGGWSEPSGIVALGERRFVLDTGHNRVIELGANGAIKQALTARPALKEPMALATDGRDLYVADSLGARVVVLATDGGQLRAFPVGVPGDAMPARPIGIAVAANGDVLVSDAANQRVSRYDAAGRLVWSMGTGRRSAGDAGFNTPAGLALDAAGNVYAVDILNGRVVKLSPDGHYLGQYGHLGNGAGALARPKDVALDAAGNVYISDSLLDAVQVFAADGEYRGFIGLKDPADRRSGALFRSPAGLAISGSTLYVVDRLSSVYVLDLPGGR